MRKTVLCIVAFILAFLLVGAAVYIMVNQPDNSSAWGWLLFCGFFVGLEAVSKIS